MTFTGAATRIYTLTLRAFPERHRVAYAAEMVDTFQRELTAQRRHGGQGQALRFVLAACLNVVSAGFGERRRQRRAGFTAATGFSVLDFILAWRMLVRYPGLSVIGVFAMAVGIAIAAGAYTIVFAIMTPALPLVESDRIVSLLNWDAATSNHELRVLRDLPAWRGLTSLEDVGSARTVERNLIIENRTPETVSVSEISASGFRVARVAPLIGRHLVAEDERADAPDAVVIGHDEWTRRFAADPRIIGRTIQLGSSTYAIVGVMPEGFAFPVNHSFWIPWRLDPAAYEPRTGPSVRVFARLAPGATLESAQAEFTAAGQRAAAAFPATHQHLRPRVMPYTYAFNDMDDPLNALAMHAIQALLVLLLLVVYVNVAILVYARTATREGEIAVRGALGASRRRIVAQLFVEALMLATVAAAIGIGLLMFALSMLDAALIPIIGRLPFWMSFQLSNDGIIYVVALTLLAAAIVGIVPALKATGLGVHSKLQGLSAGSGSRMQMGGLWTTLIVAQVALTVALLPGAMVNAWGALRIRTGDAGFASREFLTAQLVMDRAVSPPTPAGETEFRARYAAAQDELERRLMAEPAVREVTFSMTGPGEELALILEVEGMPLPPDPINYNIVAGSKRGHLIRFNRVATDYFETVGAPLVMGRGFQSSDVGPDAASTTPGVLVNRTLVETLFGGANPLSRRIRYVGRSREADARNVELDRWYEIVGVVPDFPTNRAVSAAPVSRVYHAAAPGDVYPAVLAVRVYSADPAVFADRFRETSVAVDPNLQLTDVSTAEIALKREQGLFRIIGITIAVVMGSVVVLSAAGIYALMSFTVARRRREIGIRAALGADPNRVLAGVFARAFGQLAMGAVIGMIGAFGLEQVMEGEMFQGQGAVILPMVAVLMTVVGLAAAVGPARRGLNIQPTEALREE